MIFSGFQFFIFFAVFFAFYTLATSYRQRAAILLAASIIFYATWKPAYLILLFGSLGINYLTYSALYRTRKLSILVFGLVSNLLLLGAVKYLALIIGTWLEAMALWHSLPAENVPHWIDWALPLGISFYTFHMLSVMIDVYRGDWTRHIRFRIWCLYVTFFPHMIAGPILRASELVEQLEQLAPVKSEDVRLGALIFLGGMIKKVLFADNLAGVADHLFAQPEHLGVATAWAATAAFGLQIYFDFSGYSEMAIGLARAMGIVLPRNFQYPYVSRNPQEFWRRWHMTLSRWLRDYLYFSLGGSRCGPGRTHANLMITMVLGGLWHGANWTFVFWGFLHGLYLIGHRLLLRLYGSMNIVAARPRVEQALSLAGWPVTMVLVSFTWVFFRANSFGDAWKISAAMLGLAPATTEPYLRTYVWLGLGAAALLAFSEPIIVRLLQRGYARWWSMPWVMRGSVYFAIAMILILFGGSSQKFIYFDF
jgi:alginate O-acetyltransferase complex protein AlgI